MKHPSMHKMHRSRNKWTGRNSRHHGPWWDARLCAQPRTAVRPLASAGCSVFLLRLLVFRPFCCCFCLIIPMYLDILSTRIHSLYISIFILRVLERERGSGEELRGIRCRASIKRFKNRHLDEQILPSPLFSHLQLMFSNFTFILQFDLQFYASLSIIFSICC